MGGGGAQAHCLPSVTALQINVKIIDVKYAGHPSGTIFSGWKITTCLQGSSALCYVIPMSRRRRENVVLPHLTGWGEQQEKAL